MNGIYIFCAFCINSSFDGLPARSSAKKAPDAAHNIELTKQMCLNIIFLLPLESKKFVTSLVF